MQQIKFSVSLYKFPGNFVAVDAMYHITAVWSFTVNNAESWNFLMTLLQQIALCLCYCWEKLQQ